VAAFLELLHHLQLGDDVRLGDLGVRLLVVSILRLGVGSAAPFSAGSAALVVFPSSSSLTISLAISISVSFQIVMVAAVVGLLNLKSYDAGGHPATEVLALLAR